MCVYIYILFQMLFASSKEPACQWRRIKRHSFDPWISNVPWRRAWEPTPVFLPGRIPWTEEPGCYSPWGCKESNMTEVTQHTRVFLIQSIEMMLGRKQRKSSMGTKTSPPSCSLQIKDMSKI